LQGHGRKFQPANLSFFILGFDNQPPNYQSKNKQWADDLLQCPFQRINSWLYFFRQNFAAQFTNSEDCLVKTLKSWQDLLRPVYLQNKRYQKPLTKKIQNEKPVYCTGPDSFNCNYYQLLLFIPQIWLPHESAKQHKI